MQQADATWDELTQSIQGHQACLGGLQQRLEHFHLALALLGEQPSGSTRALAMQMAALQQQIAQLEEQISQENARRSAATRQFEQARLALTALRRPRPGQWHILASKLLNRCLKPSLRFFWTALQHSCEWSEIIPSDLPLENRP
ncbi:MAG TPA: hypothetical protein VKT82_29940 [Ktedonobacterales bacterium]|nr:hypothetical protein [Ktedonobacterales bacterium]